MKMLFIALTLVVCPIAAIAQDIPKGIDFTRPLTTIDGKPLVIDGLSVTLGSVSANCLAQEPKGSPSLYALAQRIANAKDAVLAAAEIHAIEECVGKLAPLVSGQVDPAIDPGFKFPAIQ